MGKKKKVQGSLVATDSKAKNARFLATVSENTRRQQRVSLFQIGQEVTVQRWGWKY